MVYDWPPPWDGLAPGPFELSRSQVKLGHEVTVFSGTGGELPEASAIRVHRLPRALPDLSLFLTTSPVALLGYLFYRLTRRVDLVHGHGHLPSCFHLYKFLFGWLDHTPYVLHLHITAAGRWERARAKGSALDFWTKYFEWPLHWFSDWVGVRVADAVVVVSQEVRDEAIKFYQARPDKISVIDNGVNPDLFRPSTSPTIHDSSFKILYVGAISRRKNIHLLVEALKFLPEEFRLVLVGRGDGIYLGELTRSAEERGVNRRLDVLGYRDYPSLPEIYRAARLLVLPSSYEGFPKVVLEALASGIPALVSGFTLDGSLTGLVILPSLEPEVIARKIKEVVDSDLTVDVSKVQRDYSWDQVVARLETIYQRIIASL